VEKNSLKTWAISSTESVILIKLKRSNNYGIGKNEAKFAEFNVKK